ncbi:MAG: single-stranded DNA-binding protein [Thermomicrobiales bacterium]
MASTAKVTVVGNLGGDPETRYTPSGTMNVRFSVATNRRFTDQSGQQQERTSWFRVTAWGKLAETLDRLAQSGALSKGKQVFVEGRLDANEWRDQEGQNRTSLDVFANEVLLLGSRADSEGGFGGGYGAAAAGAAGARSQGRMDQEAPSESIENVPWDDSEPPF